MVMTRQVHTHQRQDAQKPIRCHLQIMYLSLSVHGRPGKHLGVP